MTRIIGGVAGGRRLVVPPRGTRPTTDRVRESLFDILTARRDLTGLAVLDLYAGSGALGLEALSRGAASALFVESDQRSAAVIGRNIVALGLTGATLRRGAVAAVLAGGSASPVDLVLADPPYDLDSAEIDGVPSSSRGAVSTTSGARSTPSTKLAVPTKPATKREAGRS